MKILVVDDVMFIRKLLTDRLTKLGYEVIEASNGEEAISKTEKESPGIVLMDIVMPKLDGIEATRRIKQSGADVKVVICSVVSDKQKVSEALQAGATDYIIKPLNEEKLIEVVQKVLKDIEKKDE